MDIPELTCANCNHSFQGQFCNNCGQKRLEQRWTVKRLIQSMFAVLISVERGYFYTIKEMAIRPGEVVRDYLNGKTIPYTNPFRYAVLGVAISAFIFLGLKLWEIQTEGVIATYRQYGLVDSVEEEVRMRKIFSYVYKFMNVLPLLLLPFTAFSSRMFFGKKKMNYAEYFIVNAYLLGQSTLYGIPTFVFFYFLPHLVNTPLPFVLTILVAGILYGQIFKVLSENNFWSALGLGIATYIVGYLFFIIFSMIVGVFIGIGFAIVMKSTL